MPSDDQILERDLLILEQMTAELPAYLKSDAPNWVMNKGDMPRLTTGGCLMRVHRLGAVRDRLTAEQQGRYDQAVAQVDQKLASQVVRFELRAHAELHARMSEWMGSLRNWAEAGAALRRHYADKVDTRVVITATIDRLSWPPYRLDPKIPEELQALDQHLRGCWEDGGFIWEMLWLPAYPRQEYWWLYGRLKFRMESRDLFTMDIPVFAPDR